jgi:putative inorganic carbon (hco3(-)) transporter
MRDLAFFGALATYLPFIVLAPHVGVMLWAWAAFFSPNDFLYGFMTVVPVSKVIAALTLLAMALGRARFWPRIDGIMLLVIVFLAQGLLSASLSATEAASNWDLFGKLAKILVLCLAVTAVIDDRHRLQSLLIAMALGLGFPGLEEGLKFLASGGGHHVIGVNTMGDNNSFALAMLMLLPILLFLRATSEARVARLGFLVVGLACTAAVIGTFSRGGFVGLVALAAGLIALNRNKLRNSVVVIAVGLALYLAAPASWFERIDTIGQAGQDESFMGRVANWKLSLILALGRPLTGGGFHAIQDHSVWLTLVPQLPDFAWWHTPPPNPEAPAAHSIYFEVLGDLGFSGLAIFLALLVAGLLACSGVRRASREVPGLAWAFELAAMIRLSLIVYMVSGAALSMAYFELVYLLLAILSVTRRLVRTECARLAAASAPAPPEPAFA